MKQKIKNIMDWVLSIKNYTILGKKYKYLTLFGIKINLNFLLNESKYYDTSKVYGRIYHPYYELDSEIYTNKPEIFNVQGEKMDIFFLRDVHFRSIPYERPYTLEKNKYFFWDRYNIALDTHFYVGGSPTTELMGNPKQRFAMFPEPMSIDAPSYEVFAQNKGLEKEFSKILTFEEKLLDTLPNATYFNASAAIWCYQEKGDTLKPSEKNYEQKDKLLSMVCSGKTLTPLHHVRNTLANKLKACYGGGIMLYGKHFGKPFACKSETLHSFHYQIVVENQISKYYFTEKILDCFISMCVPIYLGASEIGKFFNTDGIIMLDIKDIENIEQILKICSQNDYEQRLPAIKENYQRALRYLNMDNRLYEEIIKGSAI